MVLRSSSEDQWAPHRSRSRLRQGNDRYSSRSRGRRRRRGGWWSGVASFCCQLRDEQTRRRPTSWASTASGYGAGAIGGPRRDYALRRDDLDIATGVGEGAVRNLVRMRLDGPGMRWSRGRSEHVLHLRCILLNGQWAEFAEHLARRGSLQLAATPTRTTPHDADKKAA